MFGGRLVDKRAFAGAVALLIVGLQHAGLLSMYFMADGDAQAMIQTRWFWEIALNFQIFLLFLMWVCHIDRIGAATGWRKARAISRLVTGLLGVSPPFLTLVIAAKNNWFYDAPPFPVLERFMLSIFFAWFVIAYLVPMLAGLLLHRKGFIYLGFGDSSLKAQLLSMAPILLFGAMVLLHAIIGGTNAYWVAFPPLIYLHGAMPYLYRAFTARPDAAPPVDTIDLF